MTFAVSHWLRSTLEVLGRGVGSHHGKSQIRFESDTAVTTLVNETLGQGYEGVYGCTIIVRLNSDEL